MRTWECAHVGETPGRDANGHSGIYVGRDECGHVQDTGGTRESLYVGGWQSARAAAGTCVREARCWAWQRSLCTGTLTREARRDILLRGLGNSGLSICSFCKNSGGRRMSMGSERRLLTSCGEGWRSGLRMGLMKGGLHRDVQPGALQPELLLVVKQWVQHLWDP